MIKTIKCDIFESGADAILHQVNCQGVMGSGVAKQVKDRYPLVYEYYKLLCEDDKKQREKLGISKSMLLGRAQLVYKHDYLIGANYEDVDMQVIVNLFAQDKYGYNGGLYTDYNALEKSMYQAKQLLRLNARRSVAIPYKMSCCRGGGDWNIVMNIINKVFGDDGEFDVMICER